MNQIYLTRVVNNRARYLKIEYGKTLFDDLFLLKRSYGSVKNSKPTGEKKDIFYSLSELKKYLDSYLKMKIKKGYEVEE